MLDTRTHEVPPELQHRAFDRVAPWRQISIAAAGPLANLLLAFVLFWAVMFNGVEVPIPHLGKIKEDSPADVAGIPDGAEVVAVDGKPVEQWMDVYRELIERIGNTGTLTIDVSTPGVGITSHDIVLEDWLRDVKDPDVMVELGLTAGAQPILDQVQRNSAADMAGLMPGDRIMEIAGIEIATWQDLIDVIQVSPDTEVSIVFDRQGVPMTVAATPVGKVAPDGTVTGLLGVTPQVPSREIGKGVFGSMAYAANETWSFTALTVTSIKKMITGEMGTSNLAGPITIAHLAGSMAQRGWEYYIRLVAMLSISLFLINLLPIPVLDGGHIVYGLYEMITRKRISLRVQRIASMAGFALLGCLILLVIYNDLTRLAGS